MPIERPARRMTLRELMTHAEKLSRDIIEHSRATYTVRLGEFRDLSRPVRRRSHYPTMLAIQNSLRNLEAAAEESRQMAEQLHEELDEIRKQAHRERDARLEGGYR